MAAPATEYEFRPAFRGDAYEWSPRPPEPAEPWTRLARHALVREWRIRAADASSGAVWSLRWEPVNRAGTRGAGLSVAGAQPDEASGDSDTALVLLLEHCRHADGVLALPAPAWRLVREGGEQARAILAAAGHPAPQFQLRALPDEERDLLAPLAGLVCLEAAARPIDRGTRAFAGWALQRPAAPDWLQRVVPPDRGRALEAFLARRSALPGILTRLRQLDERVIRGAAEVERVVGDLRKLADLGGTGGVRLRASIQPPDGSLSLRLAEGELQLPRDHETSIRIARVLGLDPPITPPRPAAAARSAAAAAAAAAPASLKSSPPWLALVLGFTAVAAAFVAGRLTAPSRPDRSTAPTLAARPAGQPSLEPPRSSARAAARPRTPRLAAAVLDRAPALPFALEEGASSADQHLQAGTLPAGTDPHLQAGAVEAGADLAESTCTANGDVLRVESDRLVIVPCGLRHPREAICVEGACRQASDGVDDLPETACARDGVALVLDRDQKLYRPASPPSFNCPAAWYGVPAANDPLITLPDGPAKTPAAFKQNIRTWAQHIRSNPRSKYTIVAYTPAGPRPREGCARATTRLRAAAAKVLDTLIAEQPALKPQLIRPAAVRTCSPSPSLSAAASPSSADATARSKESAASAPRGARPTIAVTHLLLVRGSVSSCTCIDPEPAPSSKTTPRPSAKPRRP